MGSNEKERPMKINFNTRVNNRELSVVALYHRNGDIDGTAGNATCEIIQVVDQFGDEIALSNQETDVLIEKGIKSGTDLL